MQSVSSRIWTRVAVFISYDDSHYTTETLSKHNYYDNTCLAGLILSYLQTPLFRQDMTQGQYLSGV